MCLFASVIGSLSVCIIGTIWFLPGSCFVSKFCILSAECSTDICKFVLGLNQKENFTGIQHILLHFQR